MRRLLWSRHAEQGFIAAIVTLISVMMATIIGAVVVFGFSQGADDASWVTETWSYATTPSDGNNTAYFIPLTHTPASGASWNITLHATGSGTYYPDSASNYTYIASNNTMELEAGLYNYGKTKHNTSADISFYTTAHDTIGDVGTYAIIVFTMMAIIPLIVVGGLMLRSLGYFSGGGGKP